MGMVQSTASGLQDKAIKHFEKELGIKNFMTPEGAGAALTVHIGKNCLGIMFFDALPDNYVNVIP
jgi:hypothetical protein